MEALVSECVHLRSAAQLPRVDASSGELLEALLDVRRRLDRVEELLATALQLRSVASRNHTLRNIQVDDRWDEVAVRLRQSAVRDEYSSAKERAAAANLEVINERRTERVARLSLALCDDAVDRIRLRMRGLQDLRQDLLALVRMLQWETTIDR
jgi:hypothetical protein